MKNLKSELVSWSLVILLIGIIFIVVFNLNIEIKQQVKQVIFENGYLNYLNY